MTETEAGQFTGREDGTMYDLLLKGGEVIDPGQGIHGRRDVAVEAGRIAAVEENIDAARAREVIPLRGRLVTPGLIDIHCHAAAGFVGFGVVPDEVGLDSGVTLLCDGGTAGAANFKALRRFILEPARTPVFCLVNLARTGLATMPEIRDDHDIKPEETKRVVEENRDLVKGIKLRVLSSFAEGPGIKIVETAKKLARSLKLPLVIHLGEARERRVPDILDELSREAVRLLDEGDILSHYMTWEAGGMILPDGTIYPELREAQKRGVVLDPCHGFNHFSLTAAKIALREGLVPTVLGTDLTGRGRRVVQSLMVTMSKFLSLGLTIDQVVEMATVNPARALGEENRRGSLRPGMPADVTVMEPVEGEYRFSDGNGLHGWTGSLLLEPRMVLHEGRQMPCRSCYYDAPVYSVREASE